MHQNQHLTKAATLPTSVELANQRKSTLDIAREAKRSLDAVQGTNAPTSQHLPLRETTPANPNGFKRARLQQVTDRENDLVASEIVSYLTNNAPVLSEYTQRRALALTPGVTQDPRLSLSHADYGLPRAMTQNLEAMGIKCIFPWQSACLLGHGLLSGDKNLVYSAPTGAGKSLVADVLMFKRVLERKKAILVLPYVALVQEKLKWLRRAAEGLTKEPERFSQYAVPPPTWRKVQDQSTIRVVGLFGGSKSRAAWADFDLAVCTIEKANSIINLAIEQGTFHELGSLVLDELHMVGDSHRGYLMELAATKTIAMQQGVQIVGMSATLADAELLSKWLDAKRYESKYRPIPIEEHLVFDGQVYPASTSSTFLETASALSGGKVLSRNAPIRKVRASIFPELSKPVINAVVALACETVKSGYGALVFCSSRRISEMTASIIARAIPQSIDDEEIDRRRDVLCSLRALSVGVDEVLERTVLAGVAFHHAGLTSEERMIVAEAYDNGILRVMTATCSLAAGINLPARRVILYGARMGRDLVGPEMLRQMRGRAGRKGKDEVGESYICCEKTDLEEVAHLMEADLPPIESGLVSDKRGMTRALLEVVAIKLATHPEAVQDYVARTLLYHTADRSKIQDLVSTTLSELQKLAMVVVDKYNSYAATLLGQAIVAASLAPEDGLDIYEDFKKALEAFVMDGEMHVFYMFTPIQATSYPQATTNDKSQASPRPDINWQRFRKEIDNLDESGLRAMRYVGVSPALVNRIANGAPLPAPSLLRPYIRFYAALQLRDLSNEVPIPHVARKYDVARGHIQSLSQTCHGFAAGMITFCHRMGWGMLASVLEHMGDRLRAGARADLLELARIPFVKSRTARVFWECGLRSLRAVAVAQVGEVAAVLMQAQPNRRKLHSGDEDKYQQKMTLKAEIIVSAASRLWEREQMAEVDLELE